MSAILHAFEGVDPDRARLMVSRTIPISLFAVMAISTTSVLAARWMQSLPEARAIALVESLGGVYIRDASKPKPPIVTIDLQATLIDDAGQVHWKGPATDDSLTVLKVFPELRVLSLVDCSVTDAGLRHLTSLPRLRMLDLRGTRVTESGVARLRQARPDLTVVHGPTRTTALPSFWRVSL